MDTYPSDTALIQFENRTYYAVRAEELRSALDSNPSNETLESVLPEERLPILFPDQPLDRTLSYFHRWPVLIVKNRANRNALNGIVRMKIVLDRYQEE
jgi:CIC family chloride channel protein